MGLANPQNAKGNHRHGESLAIFLCSTMCNFSRTISQYNLLHKRITSADEFSDAARFVCADRIGEIARTSGRGENLNVSRAPAAQA